MNSFDWREIDGALLGELVAKVADNLECHICSETMVVPVTCECGHSFCYECISSWFQNKLSCPTCRASINEKPKRSMQLHQITKMMFDVATDTIVDPQTKAKTKKVWDRRNNIYEQAVRDDTLYGDLFDQAQTMIDTSDGVPRCGNCGWEVHGEQCDHCGVQLRHPVDEFDDDEGDIGIYTDDDDDGQIRLNGRDSYESDDGFVVSDEEVVGSAAGEAPSMSGESEWLGFSEHEANTDNERPIHQRGYVNDSDSDVEYTGTGHHHYSPGNDGYPSQDDESIIVDDDSVVELDSQYDSTGEYDFHDDAPDQYGSGDDYDDSDHNYDNYGRYTSPAPPAGIYSDQGLSDDEELETALDNFNGRRRTARLIYSDSDSD